MDKKVTAAMNIAKDNLIELGNKLQAEGIDDASVLMTTVATQFYYLIYAALHDVKDLEPAQGMMEAASTLVIGMLKVDGFQ